MSIIEPGTITKQPPQPPEIKRRLLFYRAQAIGFPIIAIIPLLALFKVFDTSSASVQKASGQIEMRVTYPDKFRYKTYEPVEILVRNTGSSDLADVDISLSKGYVEDFVDVQFEPDITAVDAKEYTVRIDKIPAGEDRKVTMDMRADKAGTISGDVRASSGSEHVQTHISTFVYP